MMTDTRSRILPLATALMLFAFAPAWAESEPAAAAPQVLHLRYEANWGGLHVADFALSLINGGDIYENRFHLETRGLTRLFSNMAVRATSRGRIVAPPEDADNSNGFANAANAPMAKTYIAERYRTEYTNRKHFRWVDIEFGQNGEPAKAVTGTKPIPGRENDWNPKDKGPEVLERVDDEHRVGVADPITMIPQLMAIVRAHLLGGPKSGVIKGFDGRRRFDMDVTYLGLATRTVAKVKHDTYHVRIHPRPVAGFKDRHKVMWDGSLYDFYLSRDGRFVPLQIVPVKRGPVITLMTECAHECMIEAE